MNRSLGASLACLTLTWVASSAPLTAQVLEQAKPKQKLERRSTSTDIVIGRDAKDITDILKRVLWVDSATAISMGAAEVQSTIVPAGTKAQCPEGRLLISNDGAKNPGQIRLLDLDALAGAATFAALDPLPGSNQRILSNDHDLVTFANGDVLYLRMGQSRAPLSPEPDWFDYTYKIRRDGAGDITETWGPGARSVIFVWRSEDCGETFSFRSSLDTARVDDGWGSLDDGSGGMPQASGPSSDPPGSANQPIWQMGGTDGPLAKIDHASGKVYYTMGVFGNLPAERPNAGSPFLLTGDKIGRSAVVESADRGSSWTTTTTLPFAGWRTEIVPSGDWFAFSGSRTVDSTSREAFVCWEWQEGAGTHPWPDSFCLAAPEKQGKHAWNTPASAHPLLAGPMSVNISGQPILVRSPSSSGLILTYRDTLESGLGDGYRVYLANFTQWVQMSPVAPQDPHPDNFILHLTAIDLGTGPVLLYWYDVNNAAQTAKVRGRVIARDDLETGDFDISESFSVADARWYGDYHTAGGQEKQDSSADRGRYEYYPVWVQPGGQVHFARVGYTPLEQQIVDGRPEFPHDRLIPKKRLTLEIRELDFTKIVIDSIEDHQQQ